MKIARALPILLFLVCVASCRTGRETQDEKKVTVRDSTYTTLEVQDTVLVVRDAEMANLSRKLDQLGKEPTRSRTGAATVSLSRNGDLIEASCECDELKEAVEVQKETITMLRETVSEQRLTLEKGGRTDWLAIVKWLAIAVGIWKVGDIASQLIRNRSNRN
jgi:hypothetical protein